MTVTLVDDREPGLDALSTASGLVRPRRVRRPGWLARTRTATAAVVGVGLVGAMWTVLHATGDRKSVV